MAAGALAVMTACGGSSPDGPSGSSGGPGPSGATITIGSNGAVSPSRVTIGVGQSVTFVNNDSRVHDMASDPHPAHTDCPSMNAAGNLSPGQTKLTNAFTAARGRAASTTTATRRTPRFRERHHPVVAPRVDRSCRERRMA